MLRITFVLNCFVRAPSGGFRVVYEYASRLAESGHQVTVVHEQWREGPGRPFKQLLEVARDKWHVRRPGGLSKSVRWMPISPKVRMTMVKRLSASEFPDSDLVVATYWTTARLLTELAPRHGKPVHLVQAYEIWGVKDPSEVVATLLLNVPKVAVSNHLAGTLRSLGVPSSQIAVVPNGLDHDVYHAPQRPVNRAPLVSVLVSDSAQKDSATAIASLRYAKEMAPELDVVGFGTIQRPRDWPKWARYRRAVSGHELAGVYRSSRVYLCSSISEGWGFPAAEAMACGAAVVSTLNGGIEDFCSHDKNSLLVPVGDPTAMAAAIVRLLHDEPLRLRLVQAGYKTVSEMDWPHSTRLFLAALHSVSEGLPFEYR